MKHLFLTCFFMVSLIGMAQEQLNDYKYIIIPKKFDGFKRENQYQTSTLIKYLFSEKGFLTVYEDELPNDLNNNKCLGLLVNLVDDSSMFTTKAGITLANCQGEEIFATKQGKSKEKDYKISYSEAIRDAFSSLGVLTYSYNGRAENSDPVTVSFKNDVKEMDKEKERKPAISKNRDLMVEQEATPENQSYRDRRPKPSDFEKGKEKREAVQQMAIREQQSYEDINPKPSDVENAEPSSEKEVSELSSKSRMGILYAQELPNGYQLVDSTPKIQLKIYKSSMPDYYLAEAGDKNGVVFEKNGKWFFEYYSGENLTTEVLNIKF